jgi:hypothetical protein
MAHLGTEQSAGNRVIRITDDAGGATVFDSYQKAAGVGTVIGAYRSDYRNSQTHLIIKIKSRKRH